MGTIFGMESKLMQALQDAELVPPNTRRVIIDIPCDEAIMLYYETYADPEKLDKVIMTKEIFAELKNEDS